MRYFFPIFLITILFNLFNQFHLPVFAQATGAVLTFTPSTQEIQVGQDLSTTILINTNGEQINRVLAKITYPSSLMTPESIDQTGSFVTLWYQQNTTTLGQLILEGGVSGSGVSGSQLTFVKINFTTAQAGTVNLSFASDSRVYRESDGNNILSEAQSVTYTISAPTPTPVPTFGGATATPTPTPGPGTPTATLLPGQTTTPTPSVLPDGGVTLPTTIFIGASILIGLIGFFLLKNA